MIFGSTFAYDRLSFDQDGRDWPNRDASRFVTAEGVNWHVQVAGTGPVLFLVHGTAGATHSWRGLLPDLARDFTVVAPDLPGHGFTAPVPSRRLSLQDMAQALAGLLRRLDMVPALAVGHSAGAAILVDMAATARIAPKAVIGLNAALKPFRGAAQHVFPPMARLLTLNPAVPRMVALSADRTAVRRLIEGTGSHIDEDGLKFYRRLFRNPGHVRSALGMMARWDLSTMTEDLKRLKQPVVLVVGTGDDAVPPADAYELSADVTGIEVVRLSGLGHLAHEEDPAAVAAIIRRVAAETGVIMADAIGNDP